MQLSLGKLRQNKRNKTKLWGGFYGWIISSKMKITQSKKAHFLKDFVDLWLCGLWSIISKEDVLVDFAGCFFSFHGRLSVLLTPSASVWSLALFQLHNTVKPAKTKKHWGVNGGPDCFQHTKGLSSLCLGSYLGCEPRLRPRASHASSTGTSASSSTSSSWLWRDQHLNSTVLHNHSLSPKNDNFVIIYSAHDVQNPYTNIN